MERSIESDLKQVREIIENRTRFLSLSGLSGILAGTYAILGAILAYRIIYTSEEIVYYDLMQLDFSSSVIKLLAIAAVVFFMALVSVYYLSYKKAKEQDMLFWSRAAKKLLISFVIPLVVGGLYILVLFYRKDLDLIAPSSLIFYGLALINASHYTYKEVRWLGLSELILGILNLFFTGFGLIFWAIGFGVLHIFYGWIMYYKHEGQRG